MSNCFAASRNDSVRVHTASTADLMQASQLSSVEELLSVGESSAGEFMDDMVRVGWWTRNVPGSQDGPAGETPYGRLSRPPM